MKWGTVVGVEAPRGSGLVTVTVDTGDGFDHFYSDAGPFWRAVRQAFSGEPILGQEIGYEVDRFNVLVGFNSTEVE